MSATPSADSPVIGTAMRPHHGLDQSTAHVSVATTVLNDTISFHEPLDAGDSLLRAMATGTS